MNNVHIKERAKAKLKEVFQSHDEIVLICVGTDKFITDSYGPLLGTFLTQGGFKGATVYGTFDNLIHALNLEHKVEQITEKHPNAYIIGVDACLGPEEKIGLIDFKEEALKPGAGAKKNLLSVGHAKLIGVCDEVLGEYDSFMDKRTRLGLVYSMAYKTAEILIDVVDEIEEESKITA